MRYFSIDAYYYGKYIGSFGIRSKNENTARWQGIAEAEYRFGKRGGVTVRVKKGKYHNSYY